MQVLILSRTLLSVPINNRQKDAFGQLTPSQKARLTVLQEDVLSMFDKSGTFLNAVKHITGPNEDAWCREKQSKAFKFGKRVLFKDKIAEFKKRKRDAKLQSKILAAVPPMVKAQGPNMHPGAHKLHKTLRAPNEPCQFGTFLNE